MGKRYHGKTCQCFFCLAWDKDHLKPPENRSPIIPLVLDALNNMTENCKYNPRRRCEKCGRLIPMDTPSSVYGCTMGSGCADYSKNRIKDNHEEKRIAGMKYEKCRDCSGSGIRIAGMTVINCPECFGDAMMWYKPGGTIADE